MFNEVEENISGPGVTPLKDAVRVLNGFGRSLETILPKLRDGYLVETAALAQAMANEQRMHTSLRRVESASTTRR